MNTERVMDALGAVKEAYRQEAAELMAGEGKRNLHAGRLVRLTLVAAIIVCLFSATAYGIGSYINSPESAEKIARQEIEVWKEMGILSPEVEIEGDPYMVFEEEEETGNDYWYGRIFPHRYCVYWNADRKYGFHLQVDTATGKITSATIDAHPDETDLPVQELEWETWVGPGEEDYGMKTFFLYDNYDDIFPADMTVDRFCSLLAEYWGFHGYTISDTQDEFYQQNWNAVTGDSLLKDMPLDNYYLTVFFEGDQKGAPMYLQLGRYPDDVMLMLGTGHAVG